MSLPPLLVTACTLAFGPRLSCVFTRPAPLKDEPDWLIRRRTPPVPARSRFPVKPEKSLRKSARLVLVFYLYLNVRETESGEVIS